MKPSSRSNTAVYVADRRRATDQAARARDLRGWWRRTLALLVPVPVLALVAGLVVVPYPVGGDFGRAMAGATADPRAAEAALWLGQVPPPAAIPAAALLLLGLGIVVSARSEDVEPAIPAE